MEHTGEWTARLHLFEGDLESLHEHPAGGGIHA